MEANPRQTSRMKNQPTGRSNVASRKRYHAADENFDFPAAAALAADDVPKIRIQEKSTRKVCSECLALLPISGNLSGLASTVARRPTGENGAGPNSATNPKKQKDGKRNDERKKEKQLPSPVVALASKERTAAHPSNEARQEIDENRKKNRNFP